MLLGIWSKEISGFTNSYQPSAHKFRSGQLVGKILGYAPQVLRLKNFSIIDLSIFGDIYIFMSEQNSKIGDKY